MINFFYEATYREQITSTNNGFSVASLGFTFKYFERNYTKVSISSNGYVCLGYNLVCGINKTRPVPYDIIVGLNHDLDPTREESGQIYYKKLELNSIDFNTTKAYLNLYDPDFEPVNIFMITYENVLPNATNSTSRTSFKIFLSSSDPIQKSFVSFKFSSCPTDIFLEASSGLNYKTSIDNFKEAKINDGQQCTGSNVEQTKSWVSDVTSKGKIKFTKPLI
jgi:hypothetical protein